MDEEGLQDVQDDVAPEQDVSKPKKSGFLKRHISASFLMGIVFSLLISRFAILPYLDQTVALSGPPCCAANMNGVGRGITLYASENNGVTPTNHEVMVATGMLSSKCLQCPLQHHNEEFEPTEKNIDYVYTLRSMNFEKLPPEMMVLHELPDKHWHILQVDGSVEILRNEDSFRRKIQDCNDFLANKRGVQK
jgi:hypothetical protein